MLVGREAEQSSIDALLQRAQDGRSAVLVLRGEPGIGKSALLAHAEGAAAGMRLLRCLGVESEHELPFAGMHQLVRPSLGLIDRLPAPQAAALRSALGLTFDGVKDRFLVSLGLLSLLAEASEEGPMLCCVDDAQWLDRPSADALVFAARRLHAEPIALLIAARDGDPRRFDAPGLDELHLAGIDAEPARALLRSRLSGSRADEGVVARLLGTARGNPLALLELPAALSASQIEGSEPILGPPPVRGAVEAAFRERVERLPDPTRLILLLAAADEDDDPATFERAAAHLGLELTALDAAERSGLVRADGAVVFRHPLVRSAVYRAATRRERRAAHEALAAVLDDPARRAWHRALVADRADEAVGAELEAAATDARRRGAHATASATFERSAELTDDRVLRGHRLRCAAQASLDAGRPDAALALAQRAQPFIADPVDAAELQLVRLTVGLARGTPDEFYGLLMETAAGLVDRDADRALEVLTALVFVAGMGGRWQDGIADTRRAIDGVRAAPELQRCMLAFVDGADLLAAGDPAAAGPRLEEAVEIGERFGRDPLLAIAGLVCLYVGDASRARDLFAAAMAERRARSSFADVAGVVPLLVAADLGDRRLAPALAAIEEGLELTRQLGWENQETSLVCMQAQVAALQGRESDCRELATAGLQRGMARGLGWAIALARLALADLELGLGHPREAIEQLEQLPPGPIPPYTPLATPDLIDAALRQGDVDRARAALDELTVWAPVTRAPAVHAMVARCRAVLADDLSEAERLFASALALDESGSPFERARTELAYGERLRRERRRVDARARLRNALSAFEGLGVVLWAERARQELRASGETARQRDASTIDDLTPRERRIAELVAAGASNRDVAGQLFLSPKTVEYHLGKVFTKLGIGSRVELARAPLATLAEKPGAAVP